MDAFEIRVIGPADFDTLQTFLTTRPLTTMFLRSNAERAGLQDNGLPYQGTYAAAFLDHEIIAVAGHFWTGNLILDCPRALGPVVRCALQASPRPLAGILRPWEQIQETRSQLGLKQEPTRVASREVLFTLDLSEMILPKALQTGKVHGRHPNARELESILPQWRVQFAVESLGAEATDEEFEKGRERLQREGSEENLWVLETSGEIVAMSGFNARVSDCVQIGGVFTPPSLRGRGYARCVVAASLHAVHGEGTLRSILFTGDDNPAAQRCYRSLGYKEVGDYGIVHFREEGVPSLGGGVPTPS